MNGRGGVVDVIRELVEAEVAAGFPRLKAVPSSTVRHFLDYYRTLSVDDAATMRAALVERGVVSVRPASGRDVSPESMQAYQRWTEARVAAGFEHGGRYQPLRLTKNIVSAGLAAESRLDPETASRLAATKAATASALRKLIKPVFADRLALAGRNAGGGDWTYERDDGSLVVRIDFGGLSDQLRYRVTATGAESGARLAMATYEGLLGLPSGWDWIVEDEAADAVDLLAELVGVIDELAPRLAAAAG